MSHSTVKTPVGYGTDTDSEQNKLAVDIDFEWEAYYPRCQPPRKLEIPNV